MTGGGVRGMEVKSLVYDEPGEPREESLVFNFFMDCRDAMGANMINTTAEHLAPEIEALTKAKVGIKILSNLADKRLVRADVSIPVDRVATASLEGMQVAQAITAAYRFAYADPYRACTHNKVCLLAMLGAPSCLLLAVPAHRLPPSSCTLRSTIHTDSERDAPALRSALMLAHALAALAGCAHCAGVGMRKRGSERPWS
jgi:hypothetical protein